MAIIESWFEQDLQKPLKVQMVSGNLFSQDNMANIVGVSVLNNGSAVTLSGTVSANVIRADGQTVAIANGTLNGNKCSVILPEAAYAVPGNTIIILKLTTDTVVTTLLALVVTVYRSCTDVIVDPGTILPSIQTLISEIQTAVASIPADYSALTTDVTNLTNAFNDGRILIDALPDWRQGTVSRTNGGYSNSTNRIRTAYIQCKSARGLHVYVPTGYKIYAVIFSSKAVAGYEGNCGPFSTEDFDIYITPGHYVRCVCGRTDDADFTPADLPDPCIYENTYTDKELNEENKSADSKTVGDRLSYAYDDVTAGLYDVQYEKTNYSPTWVSGRIDPDDGDLYSSSKHIRTGYIEVYNDMPIQITCPNTIKCMVFKYEEQSVSSYEGYDRGFIIGNQRITSDCRFVKIVACKVNGSDISTSDAENITVSHFTDTEKQDIAVANYELDRLLEKKPITPTWEQGKISALTGAPESSDYHIRTGYIKIAGGNSFRINYPEGLKITVYEYDMQSYEGYDGTIVIDDTKGYVVYNSPTDTNIRIVAEYVTEEAILPAEGDNISVYQYYGKKELSILVIGNSFSMDSFAYLPPVLNEIIKDYQVNYGVAYQPSASISDHVTMYGDGTDSEKYRVYYEYNYKKGKWVSYTSYGTQLDRGKTLGMIMALRKWDIIYVQPASNVTSEANVTAGIVTPGRQLLRILQDLTQKPFTFLMGEWMGTIDSYGDHGETVFGMIADAMKFTQKHLAIDGVIPIGAAIQDARTNATLQALGAGGNMLYSDNIHMQSGIAPLIAAYTIAIYISRIVGNISENVYGASWEPTTENATAINAYHTGSPTPMTHGESVGVSDANIKAAQEIAVIANNYPYEVVDCSNFIIT